MTEAKKKAAKEPSAVEYRNMDNITRQKLNAQDKVRIRLFQVPHDSNDKPWPDEIVFINGVAVEVPRGQTVEVPQSVADILEQSGRL